MRLVSVLKQLGHQPVRRNNQPVESKDFYKPGTTSALPPSQRWTKASPPKKESMPWGLSIEV
jgi:hypothetical protein